MTMALPSLAKSPPVLKTGLTAAARIGALASLCLLVIGFVWLSTTMISGAIIAPGQAVVRGKPKVVQSLDGGVVSEIRVKDGDLVQAGDVLLRLDPTLLQVNLDIYHNRLAEVLARESRLQAEYRGDDMIAFPSMAGETDDLPLDQHIVGQREIFIARREVLAGRKEQLRERILQFKNQITGVEGRTTATQEQLVYIETGLKSVQALNAQGLARESQVLELQRNQASLLGQLSEAQSELARIRNSIRDTELEILQSGRQFKEEVVTELREATAQREEIVLQIVTVEKQLERIEILAPVDGVIHEMQVFTVGGVVPPDGTVLEVIPVSQGVEFELRVDPRSIDQVFVGQSTRVVFPSFNMRTTLEVFGEISAVSPTSLQDATTGQSYYRATLTIPPEQLALLGDVTVIPGMPVEAFLLTSDRSVRSYLTKPLLDQLQRAFRDG